MKLILVTKETLPIWYPRAAGFVWQIAAGSGGRLTENCLHEALKAGDYWMALAVNDGVHACMIAQSVTWKTGLRELVIVGLVGNDMKDWVHLEIEIAAWAKADGFHKIRPEARPGWARVMKSRGYQMTHVILEKML